MHVKMTLQHHHRSEANSDGTSVALRVCENLAVNGAAKQQDIPPTVGVDLELHC